MPDFGRNIRVALRGLRRTPTFTIAAILILGFGIGTSVAMFTVFRSVLFGQLPVRDPDRLVVLNTYKDPAVEFGLVRDDIKPMLKQGRTLVAMTGYAHWGTSQAPLVDGDRTILSGRVVADEHFFDVLGTRPYLGRLFRAEDGLPGNLNVLVISYNTWRSSFGGDPRIVGHKLVEPYTQSQYTIIGVAPPGLDIPSGAGYWLPGWENDGGQSIYAIARLAPGATPAAASAELFSVVNRVMPELHLKGAKAVPLMQAMFGDIRPALFALTAAVGLLLLIVCVNVGNLLLLRATSRTRELAIRRALGASYGNVVAQLLVESGLLGVGGGLLGLACAAALLKVLIALAPPQLPRLDVIALGGTPVLSAIGVTFAAVLVFGVVPALFAARADVAGTLRLDSRSGQESKGRRRMRHFLVASQAALALVMLAGGGLLARSLARLEHIDLGYNAEHLTHLAASWPAKKYDTPAKMFTLGEEVLRRWRSVPGVEAVTPTFIPPLLGDNVFVGRPNIEGRTDAENEANPIIPAEAGDGEYFHTWGIPIIRGRAFTDDDRENTPQVAVISEGLAKRFWPKEDPIGKRINFWAPDSAHTWRTVIGVAADAHLREMKQASPAIYMPWRQTNFFQFDIAVRTKGPIGMALPALRRELKATDPQLNLWYVHPMDELLSKPLAQPRMSAMLMVAFGAAALLLAAIGLYGLMASIVRDQTREIGIRMALGASPERLRRDVLGHAMRVAGIGAAAGLVVALLSSQLLAKLLYEISPTDPVVLIGASIVLMLVVLIAAYLPARWATRIDPARALRAD